MHPTSNTGRIAGVLYLVVGVTAPFSLIYVPNALIVPGNATATATNIVASERLFRMGIVSDLISSVAFIFLLMALYRLLNGVNKAHASLMVILALVSVPISFFNMVNQIAALTLLRGGDFLSVFDRRQLEALAMFFLDLRGPGVAVAEMFWGLWLFPFGLLVRRSGFLPRILGVLLIINGFAYVAVSLTSLLQPSFEGVMGQIAIIPEAVGELSIMGWLLIKGAKVQRTANEAS